MNFFLSFMSKHCQYRDVVMNFSNELFNYEDEPDLVHVSLHQPSFPSFFNDLL